MRWERVLLLVAVLAGVVVSAPSEAATNFGVEIKGRAYNPKDLQISIGDSVTWTNSDEDRHTVKFDDGSFDSNSQCADPLGINPCMRKGQSASRLFSTPGTFSYRCEIHGQKGTVTVASATTSSLGAGTTSTTEGPSDSSSTTASTAAVRATTSTARVVVTASTVLRTTTTTAGIAYTPIERGAAPSFDPDGNEDTSPVPETDEAAQQLANAAGDSAGQSGDGDGDGGGGGDGGGTAMVIVALLAVGAGGAGLLWKLRPKKA